MNTDIVIAIISAIAIIVSALITRNSLLKELEKKNAVIEEKLNQQGQDLKEHNHYAKLFSESMPLVEYRLTELCKRVEKLEQ